MILQLETEHLSLRKAKESDLEAIYRNVWSDTHLAENMLWKPTETLPEAKERMQRTIAYQSKWDAFFVCLKETDEAIGFAGIRENEPGEYEETGICIASRHQHKGYGKEVLQALLHLVFDMHHGISFRYGCFHDNEASARLCKSAGFVYTATETRIRDWDQKEVTIAFYIREKSV